jgi:hypothetical protein
MFFQVLSRSVPVRGLADKDLLVRRTQLNTALDLDKGERQAAEPEDNEPEIPVQIPAAGFPAAAPRRSASPALGA